MSLGESLWSIQAGGGQSKISAQQLARAVVHIGCSPLAAENTLIPIGDPSSIPTLLDSGELAEICALTARKGQALYAICPTISIDGVVGAVTQTGTGTATVTPSIGPHKAITVKCIDGGTLGTATFKFSLDGGTTWSAKYTSTVSSYVVRVPGTYCTLTFAAATYVATKTLTVGTDGTVTAGSGWVGSVTQASSPIDAYEVKLSVIKAGALGTATVSISLDAGNSTEYQTATPASGVMVIPGTGIVLTLSGTFVADDTYSFPARPPSYSTTNLNTALTVLKKARTLKATLIHPCFMPSSAASAFSHASTLETALLDAFANYAKDWGGMVNCPSSAGGLRISSTLTGRKQLRGLSWLAVDRYVDTDPRDFLSAKATGPLRAFLPAGALTIAGPGDIVAPSSTALYDTADTDAVIVAARGSDLLRTSVFVGGRDEYLQPGLDDVQINTCRTYSGPLGVYLTITSGGAGWKNLTVNASYQSASALRALNTLIATMRPIVEDLLSAFADINRDGTIAENQARSWDTLLDLAVKRTMGLEPGGEFALKQCAFARASVLRSSQLGATPKRLDVAYDFQPGGEVTAINNKVNFAGVLSAVA